MSHNGFLCVLPTSLIEAIPLDIVSGWAGGDSRSDNNLFPRPLGEPVDTQSSPPNTARDDTFVQFT
eukprot:7738010-Pyramimonas_sp.AAC.1